MRSLVAILEFTEIFYLILSSKLCMQDPTYVKNAFQKIADKYVVTNHVLSLGTDILWRKKVGRIVKKWQPKTILDVATGTGDLALELQKACPEAQLVASDFCPEMLAHAERRGVKMTQVVDAMQMPFDDEISDVLTVAFGLRNMASYPDALKEMHRVIRPGGRLLVLDFSLPKGMLAKPYGFYLSHLTTLGLQLLLCTCHGLAITRALQTYSTPRISVKALGNGKRKQLPHTQIRISNSGVWIDSMTTSSK